MPKPHYYELSLTWAGPEKGPTSNYRAYDRTWRAEFPGRPDLIGSADPTFRGDGELYNPEDLLVAALASCHMLSYLALCARHGIEVLAYQDSAKGTMSLVDGGFQFTLLTLYPRVVLADPSRAEQALLLQETAHKQCFIARSVNFPVVTQAEIVDA